jgi:dihydrofolate reductase
MHIALIVAVADNGVIGDGERMPWHLPRDLAYFKQTTMGCPVIMGRKTYDSILSALGKPLPGRLNIVISRTPERIPAPASGQLKTARDLDEALAIAQQHIALAKDAAVNPKETVFVIGGGQIYAAALNCAQQLFVTHVHTQAEGSVHFPSIDLEKWRLASAVRFEADSNNANAVTFSVYETQREAKTQSAAKPC